MTEEIYEQNEFIPKITDQICVRNIASVGYKLPTNQVLNGYKGN